MKTTDIRQTSMFELIQPSNKSTEIITKNAISVINVQFISQELTTYMDLFRGYNEIRVITYSYALSFIQDIMKYFNYGEIIIGFENLINKDLASLFALQEFSIQNLSKMSELQQRINLNELKFYVVKDFISHQKIYLLKADDGRVRTITGSANFSRHAWNGEQIENIIVCDDRDFYYEYEKQYETLQQFSCLEISNNALPINVDETTLEELPILKNVTRDTAIVINASQDVENQEAFFHIENLSKQWEERLKPLNIKKDENGSVLFTVKHAELLTSKMRKDNIIKKEKQQIYPQFILDFEKSTAVYNQEKFNLIPDSEKVLNDLNKLIEYMNGFELFTKNTKRLKTLYWKVLNYLFLSPFIAKLRYEGYLHGYEDRFFPMYMLIYGDSDAGKTGFIKFSQQLMFNETGTTLAQKNFSSSNMSILKRSIKGYPVLIDELTPTYWKYAKDIVKLDRDLITDKITDHPTFILLSNDINNVAPELSKRVIIINLDNRLDRKVAAYNSKKINSIRKSVDNALYCEYLRRMFNSVDELIEEMRSHDDIEKDDWIPDIFSHSATVLQEIMCDYQVSIPNEFKIFTWFDYMGDAVIGEKATNIIKDEFNHNSKIFHINNSKNELEIDLSCYDQNESKKKLKILHDELPADVECKIINSKAILKLDAIKKHTGLTFKKNPFWRR